MRAQTFLVLLALLSIAAMAQPAFPISYYGHIFQDEVNASSGTIIEVFVNGTIIENTTTPSTNVSDANEYLLSNIMAPEGTEYVIYANGVEVLRKNWTVGDSGIPIELNVYFNSTENGGSCTYDSGCASEVCCSGTCQASCGGVSYIGGGGGGGGGGAAVQTVEEPPATVTSPITTPNFNIQPQPEVPVENTPPTFGTGNIAQPTNAEAPVGETGLTPAATGLFKIGNTEVSWQQLAIGVLFLAALVGGGYWSWKSGKAPKKK